MKAVIEIQEGSSIKNLTAPSGAVFPDASLANEAELFYLTSGTPSLYVYRSGMWVNLIKGGMVIEWINATSNTTLTLPDAALFNDNIYRVKRIDNQRHSVQIKAMSGQALDGGSGMELYPYEALTLTGYNGNWYIV